MASNGGESKCVLMNNTNNAGRDRADVISVDGGKKFRFKVVWIRDSESHHLFQAAIHL
jgi:hypothetical protein